MLRSKPINEKLKKLQIEIQGYADEYGLDYFPQIFEMCDYQTINILAAQEGFPTRYPHWRFGMQFDQMSKGYRFGIQKIYEMVINTNPCYAYLLEVNNWVDQKLVMAHVYGHNDFFKNNAWFANTDRKMMDTMANHGAKVRRYIEKYGIDRVENFIDAILSLENLIDMNHLFETDEVRNQREETNKQFAYENSLEYEAYDQKSEALKTYLRSKNRTAKKQSDLVVEDFPNIPKTIPEKPVKDILHFLLEYAPIEEWEADIIGILREEAYYYLPQRITKIMNEGWASYWHSKIMTERALDASEIIDFADKHAGVMVMSKERINPYKVGIELFRDIEHRWDTGKFGKEYLECTNMVDKHSWDQKLAKGKEKIFQVRKTHNDISFIDEFLTPEFCDRQQMFTYKYNPRSHRFEIDKRDFQAIKQKLLMSLTNFGSPVIELVDANFDNKAEVLLTHRHDGVDLDAKFANETMKNIFRVWKRPVNLATTYEDKEVVFRFDGKELSVKS